jgi:hypothetical protein
MKKPRTTKKWEPRYLDHKMKADEIAKFYLEHGSIALTAKEFQLSEGSIYRYLVWKEVPVTQDKDRLRDNKGRYIKP